MFDDVSEGLFLEGNYDDQISQPRQYETESRPRRKDSPTGRCDFSTIGPDVRSKRQLIDSELVQRSAGYK